MMSAPTFLQTLGRAALKLPWRPDALRRGAADYGSFPRLLIGYTARLKLRGEPVLADSALWDALESEGVRRLGDYVCEIDGRRVIAGQHPVCQTIALVVQAPDLAPYVEFMSLSATNTVKVLSGAPGTQTVRMTSLRVVPHADRSLAGARAAMALAPPGRAIDPQMLTVLVERVHAARMDHLLAHAPGLAELQAHARLRAVDPGLLERRQQRALDINRETWLRAVRAASLDNARRKFKLKAPLWNGIAGELIVIHPGMHGAEVVACLDAHPQAAKLGAQLGRQDIAATELFDEINRRLDEREQFHLVLNIGVPLPARVFASAAVALTLAAETRVRAVQ